MTYTPKYLLFISTTDKQILNEDLLQEIDDLYNQSLKSYQANNIEENIKYLKDIWGKLPGDKDKLSVSYHIVKELVEDYMIMKNYKEAQKWAMETFYCSSNRHDYGERELLVGKAAYESGDIETAKEYLTVADKKSNGRVFNENDIKYLKIIRNNEESSHSLKNTKKSKDINDFSKDDKHYTEEELERLSELDVSSKVIDIINEAEDLLEKMKYKKALKLYEKAFGLLDSPVQDYLNELHIQEGIGEVYFHLNEYEKAIDVLKRILVTPYGEETDNPNILLRLGQSLIESGEFDDGKELLLKAYTIGSFDIFKGEDPKYYDMIKRKDE